MSIRRLVRVVPLLALGFAASGAVRRPAPPVVPVFSMFRGGNLERPVVLGHSNAKMVTVNGRSGISVDQDPLAMLYQTRVSTNRVPPDFPDIVAQYDVAEFFGPEWTALAGPDGQPTRALRFEEAGHISHLFVMRQGPMMWQDSVVAPSGGSYALMLVSDTGKATLKTLGLRVQ